MDEFEMTIRMLERIRQRYLDRVIQRFRNIQEHGRPFEWIQVAIDSLLIFRELINTEYEYQQNQNRLNDILNQ